MSLALPNLDDRRWADLVEDGRALIPLYAPEWTDHNVHDPGITLMELLAWIAEMDLYRLNRIPETHRRKFLALAGVRPLPPQPAQTVLQLKLNNQAESIFLPKSLELVGSNVFNEPVAFRTLDPLNVINVEIKALQPETALSWRDLSKQLQRNELVDLLGSDPAPGAALYLGFAKALPQDKPVSLFFIFSGLRAIDTERQRLLEEMAARRRACRSDDTLFFCAEKISLPCAGEAKNTVPHHSVQMVWEFFDEHGFWRTLDASQGEVIDETRSLTLNGRVVVKAPALMRKVRLGDVGEELYYLRCRFIAGAYDEAPRLQKLLVNGVRAEQAASIGVTEWKIAPGARIEGKAPAPGKRMGLELQFNEKGEIIHAVFFDAEKAQPQFFILEYIEASGKKSGRLAVEAELLGHGEGRPGQKLMLSTRPALETDFHIFTIEAGKLHFWKQRDDFDSSMRGDEHFQLNASEGSVHLGDGENGRVAPKDVPIFAMYSATKAEAGNVEAGRTFGLLDSPHNRALLRDKFEAVKVTLEGANSIPAEGGSSAETVAAAAGRALLSVQKTQRAVTLEDYKVLALETPGTRIARLEVRANLHPRFPCFNAPGLITLIVLPYLPEARPIPSEGLRRVVAAYLASRRVIGTRVEVVAPEYRVVNIRASVKACPGSNRADLQQRIVMMLNQFFHPLAGGPDGKGWPFGRDVYRSEVLQVIDETNGVDHVLSLELVPEGATPQCGNLCIGALGLVASGQHQIEVM